MGSSSITSCTPELNRNTAYHFLSSLSCNI